MYDLINILTESATPVKSTEIEQALGIPSTTVRELVNYCRCEGVAICSGRNGYWIATCPDDIKKTIANMEHRIAAMTKAIDGLKSVLADSNT